MENYTDEKDKEPSTEIETEEIAVNEEAEPQLNPEAVELHSEQSERHENIPVWELMYGVIFQPNKTFPLFRYYQPWGWAMVFLFVVNLVTILLAFLSLNPNDILWSLPPKLAGVLEPMRAGMGVYASIFLYPLTIMLFAFQVSILHFLAELVGGRGQVLGLFSALAFIQILGLLSAVAKMFTSLLANSGILFFIPLGLAMGIWQLVLSTIAIREIYLLSTWRSLLVIFLPIIIVISVLLYMVFIGIAFVGPFIGTFRTYM